MDYIDRRDVDEYTGLATCLDGSHEEDWRDCEGGGSENEKDGNDDDNENDNERNDVIEVDDVEDFEGGDSQ